VIKAAFNGLPSFSVALACVDTTLAGRWVEKAAAIAAFTPHRSLRWRSNQKKP